MDNMEASCVFYVNVGTFTHLEQSKISLLTINKPGIVTLTLQHDMIVSVIVMQYPGDYLRQTSADVGSLEQHPIDMWWSVDAGGCTPQLISVTKQTASDRLFANCGAVGNPCNLQPYSAWFILSITIMLAATYSIPTRSQLYSPQGFPLPLVIIFLSYSSPAHLGYSTTSAQWERIEYRPIGRHYTKYGYSRQTTRARTQVSSLRPCQCSHQTYDPGCKFHNPPQD